MNRFEKHPRLTLILVWLGLFAVIIGAVGLVLPLVQDRLNRVAESERGEARVLKMREWPPGMVKVFAAPKNRANDPIGPVDDEYEIRTDHAGFIWPSVVHAKPNLEIVFLGGSTTECMYVRPAARFPHLVGRLLEGRSGLNINSINAGMSGDNTMHLVLNYLGKVAPRRPRFVVLMEAVNDVGTLTNENTYWNDDKDRSLVQPKWTLRRAVREELSNVQRRIAALLTTQPPIANSPTAGPDEATARQQEDIVGERLRNSFEPALRSFVRLARAWGSEPILMTQVHVSDNGPDGDFVTPEMLRRGNFDRASFSSVHNYANAIVRHVAVSENAVLIDLVGARHWTREDVYDGLHFTETGSRHVAEIVADAIGPQIVPGANNRDIDLSYTSGARKAR